MSDKKKQKPKAKQSCSGRFPTALLGNLSPAAQQQATAIVRLGFDPAKPPR